VGANGLEPLTLSV